MTDIDWSGCPIVERDPEKMGGVSTVRAWRLDDVRTILTYAEQADHIANPV